MSLLEKEPTFFEGRRTAVYFKGGQMLKDKKTDRRYWRMKWVVTVHDEEANASGGSIQANYRHLQKRDRTSADEVSIAGGRGMMTARVFMSDRATISPQVIVLEDCYFHDFSMSYVDEGEVEFLFQLDVALTDAVHAFVKNYAFNRFGVEFEPKQKNLLDKLATEATEHLQELADRDGVSMSIEHKGKTIEFKPKGPVN